MKRRNFLKNSGLIAAGSVVLSTSSGGGKALAQVSGAPVAKGGRGDEKLRCFIISDAHFGWRHDMCPTQEEFRRNMRHLMDRFPDLDLFVDSGDAHHSYAEKEDIENWTEVVQSGLGPIPLHFVSGNHEIDAWGRDWDPEVHAGTIASLPARPYYSFDIKGIHFLVIPQMIMMSFVSREAQEWARLDLALNRDKTTIILSHNSLKGTTEFQTDLGYRQTVNSEEVLQLIRENPQVVAWMHGHNHTYELVPVDGVAYVSNGRFGGFNPDPLPGVEAPEYQNSTNNNLGGFLVEVEQGSVRIRAYNCSFQKFFDEMGSELEFLHWQRTLRTSLDVKARPVISYGHGRLQHGMKLPMKRHYVAADLNRMVYLTGAPNEVINENSDLGLYTERTLPDWRSKHIPGFLVRPMEESEFKIDPTWHWTNPGIRLDAKEDPDQHKMLICPGPAPGRRAYFRCVPGTTYEITVEVDAGPGGQRLELIGEVCAQELRDTVHRQVAARFNDLESGTHVYKAEITVGADLASDTIFAGDESRGLLQLVTTARFQNLQHPVTILRYEVRQKGASGRSIAPSVAVGDEAFGLSTPLKPGQVASFGLSGTQSTGDILHVECEGNRQVCVLIREEGAIWQVRNAEAAWSGGGLDVGPTSNPFSRNKEVILAPVFHATVPYISRVKGADSFRIVPPANETGNLQIASIVADGPVEMELVSNQPPVRIDRGEIIAQTGGTYRVMLPQATREATIAFS